MALWNAGQARLTADRRARMRDDFHVARDAGLEVLVSSGYAKARGSWRQPAYVQQARPPVERTPAARDRMLAKLGSMLPGVVVRTGRSN